MGRIEEHKSELVSSFENQIGYEAFVVGSEQPSLTGTGLNSFGVVQIQTDEQNLQSQPYFKVRMLKSP